MVASHEGESVALDLELTPTLIAAGNVREVIRFIQDARKTSGFDISDRITVAWNAPAEIVAAIESAQEHISAEVLATQFTRDASLPVLDGEVGFNAKLLKS
jgi:isoleucyl-tRNA synthetase